MTYFIGSLEEKYEANITLVEKNSAMIYLLTAIGLSPGGSSTVHIYTQTIHRTIQNKQYIEQHNKYTEQHNKYTEQHKYIEQHNKHIEQHNKIHRTTQQNT